MRPNRRRKRILIPVVALIWATALLSGRASTALPGAPEPANLPDYLAQAKKLTASDAVAWDIFGSSVAISGQTLVVGAYGPAAGTSGSAYVFERTLSGSADWIEVKTLTSNDPGQDDGFGYPVAIFGDTLIVGAAEDDDAGSSSGSVYVFERNQGGANNWGVVKKLTASDGAAWDSFGTSIAVHGDTAVLGAPGWDDSGTAYVFERNHGGANNWGELKKLTASGACFGASVGLSADTAVAGDQCAGSWGEGSARVFERNSGGANNWGEVKELTASDAAAQDEFGVSVGISMDTVVVGAWLDDHAGSVSGSAYVFGRDQGGAGTWGEVKKLTASDAAAGDGFGLSVATSGDAIVIGARWDDIAGKSSGSAYVYGRDHGGAGNWGEYQKLTARDRASSDFFGSSVVTSGEIVVAGAPGDDDGGLSSGSAYVFEPGNTCYVLDSYGGLHAAGGAPSIAAPPPPYFGFDIARDVELSGTGAYVLDGFGGVHPAGGEAAMSPGPPYFGFDIAKDIEPVVGGGGYVLDGFGGVHSMGGAPVLSPATPYFGFDAARDLEIGGGGYYVLDGWGGLHNGGGASVISPGPPYFGFDIAQDLELAPGGGAYVLDGRGGVHAFGGAPILTPATPYLSFNIVRDMELAPRGGYYVLDGRGFLHAGGGATPISPPPPLFWFDAARDLEIR